MSCADHPALMAEWYLKLLNLTGLTKEQKDEAEVTIPSMFPTPSERNLFLRGSDEEDCRRVSMLLAKAGESGPARPMSCWPPCCMAWRHATANGYFSKTSVPLDLHVILFAIGICNDFMFSLQWWLLLGQPEAQVSQFNESRIMTNLRRRGGGSSWSAFVRVCTP